MDPKQLDKDISSIEFSKSDTNLTYRKVNHYKKVGLIEQNSISGSWLKLNGYDLIWIQIVESLRKWGVSLKKLSTLRDNLFNQNQFGSVDIAQYINKSFQEEVIGSIINRHDLFIVVFEDMTYSFQDSISRNQWAEPRYKDLPHINIPLKQSILKVTKNLKSELHYV